MASMRYLRNSCIYRRVDGGPPGLDASNAQLILLHVSTKMSKVSKVALRTVAALATVCAVLTLLWSANYRFHLSVLPGHAVPLFERGFFWLVAGRCVGSLLMLRIDPIRLLRDRARAEDLISPETERALEAKAEREVAQAVAFAEAGTFEPVEQLTQHVYARSPR